MSAIQAAKLCDLCGSGRADIVWSEPRGRLVKCTSCGLVYADTINEVDYTYWEDHGISDPADDDFYWDDVRRTVYSEFLGTYTRPGDRLLDVGAGKGYFVAAARKRGVLAEGIEVSPSAVAWATQRHGPWFMEGLLEGDVVPNDAYHVVTLWDVVEHLPNPTEVIRSCHRVLAPGGRLFIQTPNIDFHLPYARFKRISGFDRRRGTYLELPDHIHQFSPRTLAAVCRRAGFASAQALVLPPISTVAGRRSRVAAALKHAYVMGAKVLSSMAGVNLSNTVHILAVK